ncbi:MAG TPA: AMP-binding protein [Burkholderiaceae bacterium]|jgi:phenylacetate-CoA ligase|nr:AMP-binding protein [Burkholderiaceae bacterium]
MSEHFDARETCDPAARERDLMRRLPQLIAAALRAPGWHRHLGAPDPASIDSRSALARLPLLRKSALAILQEATPPLGALVAAPLSDFGRLFASPGPIHEVEARRDDAWRSARGLFAAGLRAGDLVLNTFSYHLTPGGFILDAGARALGCTVIPAGPGNTGQQVRLLSQLKPSAYCGTPDFLKILLDAAEGAGVDPSLRKAVVSGAAFPASLQDEFRTRGIDAYQIYATADLGLIAYDTAARAGLVVTEDVLVEIVRPGTGDPVADGEVGEVVVTSFDPDRPWIRLALGDLSAIVPGASACGRTNVRIRGWLGRADQTAKVKGLFVRPEQIAEVVRRHPEVERARLIIGRANDVDVMTLLIEAGPAEGLEASVAETLRSTTTLGGRIERVARGSLPNDGKVIEDSRPTGA